MENGKWKMIWEIELEVEREIEREVEWEVEQVLGGMEREFYFILTVKPRVVVKPQVIFIIVSTTD